jgi:ribosome-binding protein aMBF1 (putative translation factor)
MSRYQDKVTNDVFQALAGYQIVRYRVIKMITKDMSPHDKLIVALGEILQERRNKLGLSQNELARASDFHRSYISDVERGYRNISLKNLSKLAAALQIPISQLLTLAEQKVEPFQHVNIQAKI